ncbi:class I SAM-dependent methyltransferase [Methanocalculus sp.]|uniref:class I SAM-dependent methyltransferase n=1 Tax=Methanocalculus sp. TaxID=2004547 RepID=UPI00181C8D9D|nr:class I SAM-dependent methyltransferase [Methanocalculus sp.]HIJ06675.1 class I SAM-dependent methyltransferase [Methanocalculus sp.]
MTDTIDWETMWADGIGTMNQISPVQYWDKRAVDYSNMVQESDCDHGRRFPELFESEGLLRDDWVVLDIASGPGAITIPFAEKVSKVVAVEPAQTMAAELLSNAQSHNLTNIEVIPQIWQDVDISAYRKQFDCVVCCHALWQFPDILHQVRRMESVSRGYCCLAHGFETTQEEIEISQKLGIDRNSFDQFIAIYNLLNSASLYPNVSVVNYTLTRSVESAIVSQELVLQKYRRINDDDRNTIHEFVNSHANNGMYRVTGKMGILWWKVA